jgi:hypothetical protein
MPLQSGYISRHTISSSEYTRKECMPNQLIVNSIAIGGAIFAGLLLFWFIHVFLKKRMTAYQSFQQAATLEKIAWEEKRRYPRVAISWSALIENGPEGIPVQLKDISRGGAFVVCPAPLPIREKLKITLITTQGGPFSLNAEVVWSNAGIPPQKVVNRGMGIRFVNNSAQNRARLNDAISASFENENNDSEHNA